MTKQEFLAMSYPYEIKLVYRNDKSWPIIMAIGNLDEILHTNKDYKPILHPLSDLTKPIEHKGEKFVPIKEIQKRNDFIHLMNGRFVIGVKSVYELDELPTWVTQLLIEWHFDIADLISKGEAIDVNTLEVNPYK